jgi:hypothetical protein
VNRRVYWEERIRKLLAKPDPERPQSKLFIPANPEIPVLESYSEQPDDSFWVTFPENMDLDGTAPYPIDTEVLLELAARAEYCDMGEIETVCHDLMMGCDQMLNRLKYYPTHNDNNQSVETTEWGPKVIDAMATWIKKKIIAGPFLEPPEGSTLIKVTCRPKPNGKARIIMDLSAPRGRSVNDCIPDNVFPSRMQGTNEIIDAVNHCGREAEFTKADWNDAYKHFPVSKSDQLFQWFKILNRFFVELCLTFGSKSSPGIFTRGAKLPVCICRLLSDYPLRLTLMHLDDLCCFGRKGGNRLMVFYVKYKQVCKDLKISLMEETLGDKAFAPTKRGICLGILLDTEEWVWSVEQSKLYRYWHSVKDMLQKEKATAREVKSVVGKILYISPLVKGSRHYISTLIRTQNITQDLYEEVTLTAEFKEQLTWWLLVLRLVEDGLTIPATPGTGTPPPLSVVAYSDAAGGSDESRGKGVGIVCGKGWFRVSWPPMFNSDTVAPCCGVRWKHKMSFLELVGHMLHLVCFPGEVANTSAVTMIDNSGSCCMWARGYDLKCTTTDTLLQAAAVVAGGLNCNAYVKHVARCSSLGTILADSLSKNDMYQFNKKFPVGSGLGSRELLCRRTSREFMQWLRNPTDRKELGYDILREMRGWGIPVFLPESDVHVLNMY